MIPIWMLLLGGAALANSTAKQSQPAQRKPAPTPTTPPSAPSAPQASPAAAAVLAPPAPAACTAAPSSPAELERATRRDVAEKLAVYLSNGGNFGVQGRRSSVVREAQAKLGVTGEDGIVGPKTRKACRALGVVLPLRRTN